MSKGKKPRTWGEWEATGDPPIKSGQAFIYRAFHRNDQERTLVAVKAYRDRQGLSESEYRSRRRRAANEVAALRELAGNGVPSVLDDNVESEKNLDVPLFLVMTWIPGMTLGDYVMTNGPLGVREAVALVTKVGEVVDRCHRLDTQILHRDIKPENIMLRDGSVLDPAVLDFGLCCRPEETERATQSKEMLGNRFLVLPELWDANDLRRLPQSDVAYLAGLLWYCCTGDRPGMLVDGQQRLPHRRGTCLSGVSNTEERALLNVLDIAMQYDPTLRHPSVATLLEQLARVFEELPQGSSELELAQHAAAAQAKDHPIGAHRRRLEEFFREFTAHWDALHGAKKLTDAAPTFRGGHFKFKASCVQSGKGAKVVLTAEYYSDDVGRMGDNVSSVVLINETDAGTVELELHPGDGGPEKILGPVSRLGSMPLVVEAALKALLDDIPKLVGRSTKLVQDMRTQYE